MKGRLYFALLATVGSALLMTPYVSTVPSRAQATASSPSSTRSVMPTSVTPTRWREFAAWKLTDGRTQAVVVPALGRVMSYGFVGGKNWLWNVTPEEVKANPNPWRGWRNWGGSQLWLAPQIFWPAMTGQGGEWPPDFAWDDPRFPHSARLLSDGFLRMTSPVSQTSGTRLIREFGFHNGDFVVRQTVEKVRGDALMASLWSVAGIGDTDLNVLPINRQSTYKNGYHLYGTPKDTTVDARVQDDLLLVRRGQKNGLKIGVDSPIAAIAAVANGEAFVQRMARSAGQYPDGAVDAGFPVEWYDGGNTPGVRPYSELELLSPYRLLKKGARWTQTQRWNVYNLPNRTVPDAPANLQSIRRWFVAPMK